MENNFDPEEMNEAINNIRLNNEQLQNATLSRQLATSAFGGDEDQNLISYQLETDKILERIEHFLKGDQIRFGENGSYYSEPTKNVLAKVKKDKNGIEYYIQEIEELDPEKKTNKIKQIVVKIISSDGDAIDVLETDSEMLIKKLEKIELKDVGFKYVSVIDEDKKPLNEYGVSELMRILSMYVTKETFLSYYDEDRINEILGDLGDNLNNFLYSNYEKLGMNTKFKESKYIIMILNILHVVESCYRRALEGHEQENIKTRGIVTQSNSPFSGMPKNSKLKQNWHPFKPSTW